MSDTTASLSRKINSAKDLQSVVRTMKALAASSIGQYEKSVSALADYTRTVELGLGACFREKNLSAAAPSGKPASSTINAIVFGSDQGLVGQFNDIIADYTIQTLAALPGKPQVWAVGERVHARLEEAGLQIVAQYPVPSSVNAITALIGKIQLDSAVQQTAAEDSRVLVFYNRQQSGSIYQPVSQRLLPLDAQWQQSMRQISWPNTNFAEVMHPTSTLRGLIREYLFISLFRACAESLASENASRLAAMERADQNIDELLEGLHSTFHHLRQSLIDEELFDVISGYEALSTRQPD